MESKFYVIAVSDNTGREYYYCGDLRDPWSEKKSSAILLTQSKAESAASKWTNGITFIINEYSLKGFDVNEAMKEIHGE